MSAEKQIEAVIDGFAFEGKPALTGAYGSGHINRTYLLEEKRGAAKKRYILQTLNRHVFRCPEEVMENIVGVTAHLRQRIRENGGDPDRETLRLVPARDQKPYYRDAQGEYWRVYHYIEDAICCEQVKNAEDFYQSALAFGHFQSLLADYPAQTLHETIPSFHDTKKRLEDLKRAVREDVCGRAKDVPEEIAFALAGGAYAGEITDLLQEGSLPLRVTHNDTKLNNVLLDARTRKSLCVIDLDTVMPGASAYDFGDSIRFGASTAAEDERDLSRVSLSLPLFEAYTRGFLKGCEGRLQDTEIEMLPMGAKLMTYECGIRFLADYLEGDVYFQTSRPGQNLDRARTQFELIRDMDRKWDEMMRIVREAKA